MKDKQTTLRLLYPQWQGGVINSWFPTLSPEDASKGYYLGAKLLHFLAPNNNQETAEVPISLEYSDEQSQDAISRKNAILKQTQSALDILEHHNPDKIVTLGGECSVSVVPFTYLANKYPNDLAVVWIDAHPDINVPGDQYKGYHAMAVTACMGIGDEEIMSILPTKIDPSKILIVGLSSWDKDAGQRLPKSGINTLSPKEIKAEPTAVTHWLSQTKASDRNSGEIKINEVIEIIKEISTNFDVVGLTVAEHLPDIEIKIKNILAQLPLIN